tara:strand:- start:178 stop:2745 length:2568 start_codon:yes stop_codon:yes gene_type:complete
MTPIQQLMLGAGGAAKKTYMDDVFSTYLWTGTGSAITINNGIDLSGEGGMVWEKQRDGTSDHNIVDTVRGASAGRLRANGSNAEGGTNYIASFNSTGFVTGTDSDVTGSGETFASFTFRRASGFFDCVTWQGNGTAGRQISHSLNCVPGMIIVKSRAINDWYVYHRATHNTSPEDYVLFLNGTDARIDANLFNDTLPTSTHFSLNGGEQVNGSGIDYVAYVFAGGEDQTTATSRSVDFDGNDYLSLASSADFNMGSGDFTLEGWVKWDTVSGVRVVLNGRGLNSSGGPVIYSNGTNLVFGGGASITASGVLNKGQWYHVAGTKSGSTSRLFLNGNLVGTSTASYSYSADTPFVIGNSHANEYFDGKVSNARVVKGTAVYTSSFKPPTEPLTNISGTVLLCCNNSSTTGKTVGPTITANGDPTASTDSPFDDPGNFVFGENSDSNAIKTGSYVGTGSAGLVVNVGWEPQILMIKRIDSGGDWYTYDSARGVVTDGDDAVLRANSSNVEADADHIEFTPTGFNLTSTSSGVNSDGGKWLYIAVRRPDGYVGKLYGAGEGTSVFAMDTGNSSATIPTFDSGFPVDFMIRKNYQSTVQWTSGSRLTGLSRLAPNENYVEVSDSTVTWDSNVGWGSTEQGTALISHMWKRHTGMDLVAYKGDGVTTGRQIPHSLNKTIEMMWVKNRDASKDWVVYHHQVNGGTNPEQYIMKLNTDGGQHGTSSRWKDTAPTDKAFTVGGRDEVNEDGENFIAVLFASVDKISSVGGYAGSSGNVSVTTGFQPRFILIKRTNSTGQWALFDTVRGLTSSGSNGDYVIYLNQTWSQQAEGTYIDLSSTGFTVTSDWAGINAASNDYIYYAHS